MEITNIKIFKAKQGGAVLGYANIILDNKFIIRGVTLIETEKRGRFISMPARRLRNQQRAFRDICHPLNTEVRNELTEIIFAAYDEYMKNNS